MKLKTALAHYLGTKLPDLHLFRDDLAWNAAGNPYPYLLIDKVSHDRRALGTGRCDGYRDDRVPVKLVKERRVLRFTLRTAGTRQKSGGRLAGELADEVVAAIDRLVAQGSADLPVPGTGEIVHVERAVFQGMNDLPPMDTGQPFVHQVAISYVFTIHRVNAGEATVPLQEIAWEKD